MIITMKSNLAKAEQLAKNLDQERKKLKQRCIKLRERRGLFVRNLQVCKNCGKEYNEEANYNWSCRTHHSQFSGEMWWCCGKNGKDQPGCKFSKHASKEDELDLQLKGDGTIMRYVRCVCCGE